MTGASKVFRAAATDTVLSVGLLFVAYVLVQTDLFVAWNSCQSLLIWAAIIAPICFYCTGLYKEITRYIGPIFAVRVVAGVALLTVALLIISFYTTRVANLPRTVPIIYFVLVTLAIGGTRLGARWWLLGKGGHSKNYKVAIFGAGAAVLACTPRSFMAASNPWLLSLMMIKNCYFIKIMEIMLNQLANTTLKILTMQ